jgi:hypothetical protein
VAGRGIGPRRRARRLWRACLLKFVSKLDLRTERALARVYLFDCLSTAIDDGHPGLFGCHQPRSWLLEVVLMGGRRREQGHWDASRVGQLDASGLSD